MCHQADSCLSLTHKASVAGKVIAIDGVEYRRSMAESFGATSATPEEAEQLVQRLTEG